MPGSNYAYNTGEFFDSPEITNQPPMTYLQPNLKFTIPGYLLLAAPKLNTTFPKLGFSLLNMLQSVNSTPTAYETKTFDRDAKLKEMYGTNASRRDIRKFNKYWNSDLRWADQDAFETLEHLNYMDNLDARWKAIGDKVGQLTATSVAEILNSLNSRQPIQQAIELPKAPFNTNYWLSEAQRVNPNFKSIDDVIAWQKENGLAADGKFGKASRAKWDSLQAPLASLQQLKESQNKATLYFNRDIGNKEVSINPDEDLSNKVVTPTYSSGKDYISEDHLRNDFNKLFANNLKNSGVKLVTNYQGGIDTDWLQKQSGYNDYFQLFKNNNTVTTVGDHIGSFFGGIANWFNKHAKPAYNTGGQINKFSNGGKQMNDQELQKAFMAYLIEDAAAQGMQIQSEQDLQAYAQQLGEEGLKAKYQEFMLKMQGGIKAKLGAKLNYINKLKGNCPDGFEMVYMKQGGRVCPVCQKKAEKAQGGKKLSNKNEIDKFKESRKKINPNDTVNTKFGPRDLNGKTKYKKYDANKENYDFNTRMRVQEKDEKSGKKVIGSACGSKMKKKSN